MTTISGWVAPGFEGVRDAFQANFDAGVEVGAAFGAYHRGEKVVDLWGGIADARTEEPWEEDTLVLVYSTTKGVVGDVCQPAGSTGCDRCRGSGRQLLAGIRAGREG